MNRRTDLGSGSVQIQNDVIGSIAALAAQEVKGVVGIWKPPLAQRLFQWGSGVQVETQDHEVRLFLRLVVEYGVNLPLVAAAVQERVRDVVEEMTQLNAIDVQVSIHEVKPKRS